MSQPRLQRWSAQEHCVTSEDKKRIYSALSAPFPEDAIQRTDGRITGRGYSTTGIGYAFITARLNEVVGLGNWRTHREITVRTITTPKGRTAHEAICDLVMELGQWNEEGKFIPWAEALADGGHTSFSEADARKGSFTNALKKAAAMFGCGRQAYEGRLDDDSTPAEPSLEEVRISATPASHQSHSPLQAEKSPASPNAQPQQGRSSATQAPQATQVQPPAPVSAIPTQPNRNRLTSKQLAALWALARKAGYDQSQFRQMVKQREKVQPEFLSRETASKLIGEMSAQLGNGHAGPEDARQPGQEG
jgi:hypothetical protein